MSHRSLQLASIIHRAVQSVMAEGMSDPRLADVLPTITRVKISQDMRSATLFVSIMPAKAESRAIHALNDAAGYVRRLASERVSVQRMPDLLFKLDRSLKKQAELMAALDEVERERRARAGAEGNEAGEAGEGGEADTGDDAEAPSEPESLQRIPTTNDGDDH